MDLTGDVSTALVSLTKTVDTTESVIAKVGNEVENVVNDVRGIVNGVRAGEGSIGKLFNDTGFYDRMNAIGQEAADSARIVRETAAITKTAVEGFVAPNGMGPQLTQNIRNTLAGIEEVTSDLAEGTEALKRNFIFRGFFDLDAISREAYQAGLLERDNRTAVRVWVDAALLFERDADGNERLTAKGRRRLDSAMAQFVQYPRDSPSGDGKWAGVALAMYVRNDVFRGGNRR